MVGGDAGDDDGVDGLGEKAGFEIGTDEAAVDALVEDRFAKKGLGLGFDGEAGAIRIEEAAGSGIAVLDVDEGHGASAPGVEEIGNALLGGRVVALAPDGIVEGLLDVDDDEGGVVREGIHGGLSGSGEEGGRRTVSSGSARALDMR